MLRGAVEHVVISRPMEYPRPGSKPGPGTSDINDVRPPTIVSATAFDHESGRSGQGCAAAMDVCPAFPSAGFRLGSQPAITRVKEAVAEIKKAARPAGVGADSRDRGR
jgi:hypothetical protein